MFDAMGKPKKLIELGDNEAAAITIVGIETALRFALIASI